ncbi:hypothetical protein [Helicobacter sp. 13S00477-4]|uniref:hypothetical protein n=1 Tax=Helicobacter sp. 13S00477-4 TaxID=1905759 RepID=UPI0015DA5D7E|nr:hypothetical protein [Helicobacter sp. 13S00477-4]
MSRDFIYKMYGDDESIVDDGYDDDFPEYEEEDEESPFYRGYDDDDYQNSDDEYEED